MIPSRLLLTLICCTLFIYKSTAQTGLGDLSRIIKEVLQERIDSLSKNDHTQTLIYLQPDGRNADMITNVKTTSFTRMSALFDMYAETPVYVFPKPDSIIKMPKDSLVKYYFPIGGYSVMQHIDISKRLSTKGDTVIYKTNDRKNKEGHYGHYTTLKEGYNKYSYAWVLPENFELLYYKCNKKGEWKKDKNIIHFMAAANENDFVFEIAYKRIVPIPKQINGRQIKYTKTLTVKQPDITVKVSDPQRIDGDIVSLNMNGDWILKGYEIGERALNLKVTANKGDNYLLLYAENLGSIPPNTAAIEIYDGVTKQSIVLNSDAGYCEAIMLQLQ